MLRFRRNAPKSDFHALLESHIDTMYAVALRYTRNSASAEDLVQDTVVKALRFKDHFEPGTNFKAWVLTVLTNTFIHRYRRQARERELLEGQTAVDVERQLQSEENRRRASNPEHAYLEQLLSGSVLSAVESLPEEFRTVVVLCDLEGLSYKEISDAIGCPVGTVMSRLYRGRRLLEGKLAHVAVEEGILKAQAPGHVAGQVAEQLIDMQNYRRRKDG